MPPSWSEFTVEYRFGGSRYRIVVRPSQTAGGGRNVITLDGRLLETPGIPLVDDGAEHEVRVEIL